MSSAGSRPRRPSLDREMIVDAALRLAQQPDPEAMSFRALGRELGADPTAVYRHFRDRNELVEAGLDRLIGQVAAAVPSALPWRERLRAAALTYFDVIVSHPVIGAEAGHRTTGGPGELAMLELLLEALDEAGLPRERVVSYYSLIAGYAASMAAAAAAYRLQDGRVELPSDQVWVGTAGLLDATRFPMAVELRDELAELRTEDVFSSGFELLLRNVEAAAAQDQADRLPKRYG